MKKVHILYALIMIMSMMFFSWAHLYWGYFDINIALKGWSAIDFSNSIIFHQNFIHDYPGGAIASGKNSILSWVYPLLQTLGISPEHTLVGMIGLEILVFVSGAYFLLSSLFRKLPFAAYLTLAIVLVLSWVRYPNLARFGAPYFHGQFYGFADGLRLLAIALFLRSRFGFSYIALIIGFIVHPLKGLFGFAFIFGAGLVKLKGALRREILTYFACFFAFAVFWIWYWLEIGQGGEVISTAEFFRFSPLLNSHWYPQDLEIFGRWHLLYLTPFISALLLGAFVLIRQRSEGFPRYAIGSGILWLLMLTAVGIGTAWFELNAFLVKSCFQRSTLLILSIVTILVVGQIFKDLESGNLGFVILGSLAIASAFVSKFTWPALASLGYAALTLTRGREFNVFWKWLGRFLFGCMIIYLVVMWFLGFVELSQIIYPDYIYNIRPFLIGLALVSAIIWIGTWLYPTKKSMIYVSVLMVLACCGGVNWAKTWRTLSTKVIIKGQDYKEVQIWARDNTDRDALFMVDPCIAYGWRDYSVRSSFGTIQEWFKTGWLYSGDKEIFKEGLSRGKQLGIDIETLVPKDGNREPYRTFKTLCMAARENFYGENTTTVSRISNIYNVNYFVFEKAQIEKYGSGPLLPVAFENKSYRVLKAEQQFIDTL